MLIQPHRPTAAFRTRARRAFSLIEMLVVIGIIAILAGMAVAITPTVFQKKAKSTVEGRLNELKGMIDAYHADLNSYPPDNPTNSQLNALFYELSGTTFNVANQTYNLLGETLSTNDVRTVFGLDGLRNVTLDPNDPNSPRHKTYANFREGDRREVNLGLDVEILRVPQDGPTASMLTDKQGNPFNAWHYRANQNAVYNKGRYDLWADIQVGNKRFRISNWAPTQPIE